MKLTLYKNQDARRPIFCSGPDTATILRLLDLSLDRRDREGEPLKVFDNLAIFIGEDEPADEMITLVFVTYYSGHPTDYRIESSCRGERPYDVEEFGVDWDAARMRFLKLALEHGQWEE